MPQKQIAGSPLKIGQLVTIPFENQKIAPRVVKKVLSIRKILSSVGRKSFLNQIAQSARKSFRNLE